MSDDQPFDDRHEPDSLLTTALEKGVWVHGLGRTPPPDPINHPPHYTSHPSGVECITITEHFGFNIGNAIKYLWRAGLKSADASEDLRKALWYVQREIDRTKGNPPS